MASVRPGAIVARVRGRRSGSPGPRRQEAVAVGVDQVARSVDRRPGDSGARAPPPPASRAQEHGEQRRRASFLPQPRDDGLAQHAARDPAPGRQRPRASRPADDERDLAAPMGASGSDA